MFIKHNQTQYPDALEYEAEGLERIRQVLKQAGVPQPKVPQIYAVSQKWLEMEEIQSGRAGHRQWAAFGEGLAALHAIEQPQCGWERDNYIGLAPQPNLWMDDWGQFFVEHRLGYQVSLITDKAVRRAFESVLRECGQVLARFLNRSFHHASLLHGDLWSGNVLFDEQNAWLIDPAVYCGDREADIAMTEMFGGFDAVFYQAYDQHLARSEDYPVKRELYNLYHYLNHYNLFGSGYLSACRSRMLTINKLAAHLQ